MVGIAQPENFSIFLRKIGYSVGLENTLSRFSDFCHLYAKTPQLKNSDWKALVRKKWDLKTENIGDVFSSLKIANITPQGIFAGPFGEAGALCINFLYTPKEINLALSNLLALSIMLADGDIFFNCLSAQFGIESIPRRLTGMVLGKRQELFQIFKSQAEQEAIATAITIERQRTNKGSSSKGSRLGAAAGLGLAGGLGHLGLPKAKDVHSMESPSADYLRHIVPSRKEWARSLGLLSKDGEVTSQGWRWLQILGDGGFVFQSGEYSLRPTKFELESHRLGAIPELASCAPRTWDYISMVARGLATSDLHDAEPDDRALSSLTIDLFAAFREFSQDRRMVRNELPLFVALASYMALSRASGKNLVDYDAWLRSDAPLEMGIKTRSSRTIELGILIGTNGHN